MGNCSPALLASARFWSAHATALTGWFGRNVRGNRELTGAHLPPTHCLDLLGPARVLLRCWPKQYNFHPVDGNIGSEIRSVWEAPLTGLTSDAVIESPRRLAAAPNTGPDSDSGACPR